MANRPKSVYLTARSMSALRESDSLSGRMNQIADRYLTMLVRDSERVRGMFAPREWAALVAWRRAREPFDLQAAELRDAFAALTIADVSGVNIHGFMVGKKSFASVRSKLDMTEGEIMVLVELLELDCATDPLPGKSETPYPVN